MRAVTASIATLSLLLASPAFAWGYEGHEIVAAIARADLTSQTRFKVDAILATDPDTLTKTDMVSRATWADAYRSAGRRETAQWHFVDTEIDQPDLNAACFGYPATDQPASAGQAQDCVVDKIREFTAELSSPATTPAERLLALKYLLHFVGDVHQPLHASDNHDRGGNCVLIALGGSRAVNLHSYWDTAVVEAAVGKDVEAAVMTLRGRITPAQRVHWQSSDPAAWATEAFQIALSTAYTIGSPAGCQSDVAAISLPAGYKTKAQAAAMLQLEKAGVRLAAVLNTALAHLPVPEGAVPSSVAETPFTAPSSNHRAQRTPASLACSGKADRQGLHGKERQRFRRQCIRKRNDG
jgi:hypothetical protein